VRESLLERIVRQRASPELLQCRIFYRLHLPPRPDRIRKRGENLVIVIFSRRVEDFVGLTGRQRKRLFPLDLPGFETPIEHNFDGGVNEITEKIGVPSPKVAVAPSALRCPEDKASERLSKRVARKCGVADSAVVAVSRAAKLE